MLMNQNIQEIIGQRYSCRFYNHEPIQKVHQQELRKFLETLHTGPLGTHVRLELAAAEPEERQSLKGLGTYGVIRNPAGFIIGTVEQAPWDLEDYGYVLEHAILTATGIGLGTCWLGGPITKSSFAKKISLRDNETMPAVAAAGYIEERKGKKGEIIKYRRPARLSSEQLFFANAFGSVLIMETAGEYSQPLEMVRIAPSASNKQPWRIVRINNAWHFFLQRTRGYGKGTVLFRILRLADLQRVDMGIAMCHFELTARELGLNGGWVIDDPKIQLPGGTEYTATWKV
jgi:nitroreductase